MNNVNTAIGLIANPNNSRLHTNFILKLNATERNNFAKANTNKKTWIRKWIRDKYGYNNAEIQALVNKIPAKNAINTFRRYVNSLINSMNNNMRVVEHMNPREPPPYVNLQLKAKKGPFKGYIQLEPVCKNNHTKGVYVHYGTTFNNYRGQKVGYRLRKAAVNAALKSKILLYQVSQNLEGLVAPGALPISGKIMKSLGAHSLNYAPPCRSGNVRGPQNFVFVVGNKPLKRPVPKPGAATKLPRTLRKRTR